MPCDQNTYRVRVGIFYPVATALNRKLSFLTVQNLFSLLLLMYGNPLHVLPLAILLNSFPPAFNPENSLRDWNLITAKNNDGLPSPTDTASYLFYILNVLLLSSGNVEPNPGPAGVNKDPSIIHINARSIKSKLDLIEAEYSDADFITVSETWLSCDDLNSNIMLPNFHPPVRHDRETDAHGGVAIYVKSNLINKPRPDLIINDLEAVWVETRLRQERFLIGSFYRPPNSPVRYWDLISDSIRQVSNLGIKFIILGDFNTDFLHSPSQHLLNIINDHHLKQLITEPTRTTETSSTCLDLILTQSPNLVTYTEVLPPVCSDHSVPYARINSKINTDKPFKRTIFNYKRLDERTLCAVLREVNWETITQIESLDQSTETFTNELIKASKRCIPSKIVTIKPNDSPWMNDNIRLLINEKKRIHRVAKKSNLPTDWDNFRRIRNSLTTAVRTRKSEYLRELNEKASNPQSFGKKEWWKIVNLFFNRKGINDTIPPLEHNGNIYYSNKDKAEILNAHFVNQSTLNNANDPTPQLNQLFNSLTEIRLTEDEVRKILLNLDPSKAVGPDFIHNKLLIAAAPVIAKPLTCLFNRSLRESKFPKLWKEANVTPIHKKGSKEDCNNYRPISLLSCIGKVLEKCIHNHLLTFLQEERILSTNQSGFIPGDSTTNQLLIIYNDLCNSLDKGLPTQAVYLDISKAFDRVWHEGLLSKLQSIGIRGSLLDWFRDYLSNRTQKTVIKGEHSCKLPIPAGVPQGSVLGPLLFLIYINDIEYGIESNIKLFADDTSLSLALEDPNTRVEVLNRDLARISHWGNKWKVKFNANKTDVVNYTRSQRISHQVTFCNSLIGNTANHKHLGLVLQSDGKWTEHVAYLTNKINPLISCLCYYKYRLSRKALETMYKSYILPLFDYADIIYDNLTETLSNKLENLHLEGIRTIIGAVRGTSHHKLYAESGFCSLKNRRARHKLIQFKKMQLGLCPTYLSDILPPLVSASNPYHRRREQERTVPFCRTELYKNSFLPSTTELWNNLPNRAHVTGSLSQFKGCLQPLHLKRPDYFYTGERKEQIIHCRLRLEISDLNADLYSRHLRDDPSCACGYHSETAEHYLLYCSNFQNMRTLTLHTISQHQLDILFLLNGNPDLNNEENSRMFLVVHDFIKQSKRFPD